MSAAEVADPIDEPTEEAAYPYTPNHFFGARQHHQAGRLGTWLLLGAVTMLFGGLVAVYAAYRTRQPEIFHWASHYLDARLATVATVILLTMSLAAAWAVRGAQLGQSRVVSGSVAAVVVAVLAFYGLQSSEREDLAAAGLGTAGDFSPLYEVWETPSFKSTHPSAAIAAEKLRAGMLARAGKELMAGTQDPALTETVDEILAFADAATDSKLADDVWLENEIRKLSPAEREPLLAVGAIHVPADGPIALAKPEGAGLFFGIHRFARGLFLLLLMAGAFAWLRVLLMARKVEFGPDYYGPVDSAALFTHQLTAIWLVLFPLFYLIH